MVEKNAEASTLGVHRFQDRTHGVKDTEHSSTGPFEPITILRWLLAIALTISIVPLLSVLYNKPLIWSVLPLFGAALLARFGNTAMLVLRAVDPWIWALLTYTVVSITWSPEPVISAKRVLQELGIVLICIALLARGYSSSWLTTTMRSVATFLVLASIVVCVVLPRFDINVGIQGSNWLGILDSKNQLGRLCLLCVVCWVFTVRTDASPVAWRLVVIVLATVTLPFTNNATSIGVLAGVLLLFVFVHTAKRGWAPVWFVALIAMLTIGHTLAVTFGYPTPLEALEQATGLVGRDTTLTGRTDLWTYMSNEIMKQPWLGTGYGAAWLGAYGGVDGGIAFEGSWDPTQGHSSYIDILLNTGVVGLALWGMVLFSHGRRLLALSRIEPDLANFHIALLFCILACSFFSSLFYRGPTSPWGIILWVSLIEVSYLSFMYRRTYPRLDYARHAGA